MTQWNPVWKVTIDGVEYTDAVLANLTIRSGRTNIYEQAQAGYVNLQLIDISQSTIPVSINSTISVQIKDTSNAFVSIFGGNVVDIGLEVRDVGSTTFTQTYSITALGALARLPKVLTNGVLSKDFDGDQIYDVLSDVLFNTWAQVAGSVTWGTYTPAGTTWATAENNGLGEIDRPGNYELAARSSDRTDVYSLVSGLATSGLGYIYEDAQGRIGYADSTHRTNYLAANGYVDLDANHARAAGLRIETRVGDVRNSLTIKYNATSSAERSASDAASIALYGTLAQIITTTLHNSADATAQANFYLSLRAQPQPIFSEVTFDLTNPEVDNADRDNLLGVFMGEAISLNNLPLNMNSGTFQGFVEGWSFQASYNQLSVTLLLSPLAYSLQAMRWNDVPITETWSSVSPTLDWENATIVA
jgi:hypothetical protein